MQGNSNILHESKADLAKRVGKLEALLKQKDEKLISLQESLGKSQDLLEQYITERRLTQAAHRETVEAYRSFFDVSPIAMFEVDLSRLRRFFFCLRYQGVADLKAYLAKRPHNLFRILNLIQVDNANLAALDLFMARDMEELFADPRQIIPDEAWPTFTDFLAALASGEEVFEGETFSYSLTGVLRYVALRCALAPGREADWSQAFVSLIDITGRKVAEDMRKESEKKYRLLVENAVDGVAVLQDEHLVYLNPRAEIILALPRSELVTQSFHLLVHPRDMETIRRLYRLTPEMDEEGGIPFCFRMLPKNASAKRIKAKCVTINWQKRPALLWIFREETNDEQEYRQRLLQKQLETAINTTESACQEINQPVQSILMHAEMLGARLPEIPDCREHVNIIQEQAKRLMVLTHELNQLTSSYSRSFLMHEKRPQAKLSG
jgi:PAS domain S-box-containing protein